jgi:hypothetical protein
MFSVWCLEIYFSLCQKDFKFFFLVAPYYFECSLCNSKNFVQKNRINWSIGSYSQQHWQNDGLEVLQGLCLTRGSTVVKTNVLLSLETRCDTTVPAIKSMVWQQIIETFKGKPKQGKPDLSYEEHIEKIEFRAKSDKSYCTKKFSKYLNIRSH